MEDYLITVCIVHYRKLPQLKETIRCLEKNTLSKIKIRILNQGYLGDGIKEYLEQLNKKENIEIIYNQTNIGCSPGRNLLTQEIKTPFIMILDDDIYVNQEWDIPVMEYFRNHSKIGAIGFSLFRVNGDFWLTGGRNIIIKGKTLRLERLFINPKNTDQKFILVDDVCAGAMIYRREISHLIDWDPHYFIGFEDLDKGLKLKNSQFQCAVSIQSKFIHDKISQKMNQGEYNRFRRDYHKIRESYLHFMKKYSYRLDFKRHIFYKYVCLLPNSWLRIIAFLWLKIK